ncbi:Uncharacterized protein Fot_28632 [Forsythia ovata]|uniref:Uncharacterized protein n=1 Tax=Forsythia ovata TaxID=205694 RepID=A0ABD1TPK4_9LAMI
MEARDDQLAGWIKQIVGKHGPLLHPMFNQEGPFVLRKKSSTSVFFDAQHQRVEASGHPDGGFASPGQFEDLRCASARTRIHTGPTLEAPLPAGPSHISTAPSYISSLLPTPILSVSQSLDVSRPVGPATDLLQTSVFAYDYSLHDRLLTIAGPTGSLPLEVGHYAESRSVIDPVYGSSLHDRPTISMGPTTTLAHSEFFDPLLDHMLAAPRVGVYLDDTIDSNPDTSPLLDCRENFEEFVFHSLYAWRSGSYHPPVCWDCAEDLDFLPIVNLYKSESGDFKIWDKKLVASGDKPREQGASAGDAANLQGVGGEETEVETEAEPTKVEEVVVEAEDEGPHTLLASEIASLATEVTLLKFRDMIKIPYSVDLIVLKAEDLVTSLLPGGVAFSEKMIELSLRLLLNLFFNEAQIEDAAPAATPVLPPTSIQAPCSSTSTSASEPAAVEPKEKALANAHSSKKLLSNTTTTKGPIRLGIRSLKYARRRCQENYGWEEEGGSNWRSDRFQDIFHFTDLGQGFSQGIPEDLSR